MPCSFSKQEQMLHQFKGLTNQISPKFERCTGISASRYELLSQLYKVDEINQSTLQKLVNIDGAAITRHLKQLEASGMVTKRRNPEDNRVIFVSLTDEGRERIIEYRKENMGFVKQMLHDFTSEEVDALSDMLQRMQDNIVDY
ncbi:MULTISPECIES: MarR family winged helix-turn-helix transcriptional regulator [unclassified Planococcus (in: firmicutes)]|uniref:MarR family winged helix-turn-helix transcriptional regulator n=1 Tax=unclassified Planococcus (in: firmicutes) TaxID=2662419 RepID=UPI000C31FE03|nr:MULTISPECIES: MarR family transcriptional regulator [unclassified Planococcus (in: firmicutes)]AUD13845.1 transcriptional regulator [Planococcus sp. MB-3u-03]PKG45648.1 transcriptional regulator [Planococcus sp. Urea-trap-24]PKG88642.1 transcriptional regulator [Planococcus sp. Urea-3u-39]PKH38639.1 transcriptional regulator [Planococcus sp. MB-3u-09]